MKASEYIAGVQALIEEHGDLDMAAHMFDSYWDIYLVNALPAVQDTFLYPRGKLSDEGKRRQGLVGIPIKVFCITGD